VVQVTVAELLVMFVVVTLEIAGGAVACEVVAKVELPEVDDAELAFAETTSKS
jgi:hypothetical protein